ncbi:MAG: T9SS type A sorting domain-containing protein [Aureispira sp.]|nr:T9SS type A sorting domain-containing protein [Aureispira sp.]
MKYLFIGLCLITFDTSVAQITFNKRMDFGQLAAVITAVEATDSCYYATGIIADDITNTANIFIKYDLNGDTIFTKVITNTNVKTYETWEPCLYITYDNNLIIGGHSLHANGDRSAIVIKYDTDGDTLWTRTFQNPLYPGEFIRLDDLIPTRDSGYLFAGQTNTAFHPADGFVVFRLDSLGNELWHYVYPNIKNNVYHDIWQDEDGGFLIGFLQHNLDAQSKNYTVECHLIKLDSLGTKLWEWSSPNGLQVLGANDVIKTKDRGFLIGSSLGTEIYINPNSNAYRDTAAYVFKLDSARNLLWETPLRPNYYIDNGLSIKRLIELPDSSIWAIGQGTHIYSSQPPYLAIQEGWVVHLSSNGDSLYNRRYHFLNTHGAEHVVYDAELTHDHGLLISGESKGTGAGVYQQGWLLKLDEHGCLVPGCHLLSEVPKVEEEEPMVQVALYPNPASDFINVYLHRSKNLEHDVSIRLVDLQGRVLQEYGQLHGGDITYVLPVSDLPVGAYVVQVLEAGEVVFVEKVLVN